MFRQNKKVSGERFKVPRTGDAQ